MPSSIKHPSRLPMWKGVKFAYLIIAMCLFPLAIVGYWAYGNLVIKLKPVFYKRVLVLENCEDEVIMKFDGRCLLPQMKGC